MTLATVVRGSVMASATLAALLLGSSLSKGLRIMCSDRVPILKNIGELSIQGTTIIAEELPHWKGIEADVYLSHDSIQDWPRIMLA